MKSLVGLAVAGAALVVLQFAPPSADTRALAANSSSDLRHVIGRARVVDGDTLEIGGERIRLEGIDAPELAQVCKTVGGLFGQRTWRAGRAAAVALRRKIGGRIVDCRIEGRGSYGRALGRCSADGLDLNAALIREGFAWAFVKYSQTFVREERRAQAAGKGVWAASCEKAWDYRAERWAGGSQAAPAGCAIKGNINRRGHRIYHMPWSPWYAKTRIETTRGERWFCDERQAVAAGWRPAVVR